MKTFSKITTAGLLALAAILPAGAQQDNDAAGQDGLEPSEACFIKGVRERVRCLKMDVPLDYASPEGEQITLHAAIIPAKSSRSEPDPIWVFAGGPGQAAGEYGVLASAAFREIRQSRDIVLVDQRGTGKSHGLRCEVEPGEMMSSLDDWTAFVADCRKENDIDVRHFTMENVVRDMEAVRQALGYDQLNLWGGSWGTRTVGLYLKRHPEHVRSIIVDGVAPPDVSLFESAPVSAERAKHMLAEDCRNSEACASRYPDFEAQVAAFLDKAAAGDLRYTGNDPMTGDALDLEISFVMAVESIRSVMYSADATVLLPFVVDAAAKGDLEPLIALYAGGASVSDSMYLGATLSILCGEEVPRTDMDTLARAAEDSFAKDSYYQYWNAGCKAWDALPGAPDAHDAVTSDVPALILSGDLDPVTPPSMGEHWLKGFPNGRHIVVAGNGHITSNTACMPHLLDEFVTTLDAGALDTACLGHLKRLPVVTGLNGTVK
ncbi:MULTISPECIES: alpha/beta fold hydrolase [Kordiimonas]|uniref:alpha/beta fold hydrolase n=1 Tax=Kordiimonas TaxID=288021 RepID=UPI00257A92EC|nr:alpha/beta fold hydrolase [Kordiimonas sp. UBA4487]